MQLIRNPFVWLWRIRHRRGYGIHSPWAYSFVRSVLLEPGCYYAYAELDRHYPWHLRWLLRYPLQCHRLLFRLANYAQADTFGICGQPDALAAAEEASLRCGNRKATLVDPATETPQLCLVKPDALPGYQLQPCRMLILEGIHRDRACHAKWEAIKADPRTGCTFDVYTYGIVFFDLQRHKQHYIVNF